jgi:hypothetical protein
VAERVAARVAAREARGAADGVPDVALDAAGRAALDAACRAAREAGLEAEHVLLALKDAWRGLPELRHVERHTAESALARLVSACIAAFYAPARADAHPSRPASAPDTPSHPHSFTSSSTA